MKKEVSCLNSRAIISYVKLHNDNDLSDLLNNLDPEIDLLPDPEAYLTDRDKWISCTVASKLYERARIILKDDMAAYKMGKFAAENMHLGYVQNIIIRAFWSTKKVLKSLQKINDRLNRNKKVELVELKGHKAIVRLHWYPGMDVSKDICLYNQGVYSFMPLMWNASPVIVEEECCYFDGAPYCEFRLRWPARNRFYEIFSELISSKAMLKETIEEIERDKKLIEKKYEEVNLLNVQLNDKVKQLQAIQETGKAILSVLNLEKLLQVIMNVLSNICMINRAVIMIVDEKEEYLEHLYATGYTDGIPEEVRDFRVPLDRADNILARVVNTGKSEYIPHVKSTGFNKEDMVPVYSEAGSIFAVPLITRSKVIGVIATDAADETGVPEETRNTLAIFAPQIALAIENARLYQNLQAQIVEVKRSQELLSRAENLAFLGDLAARLAHEIRNPMVAIGTFLQMLPYKFNDEEYRNNFYKIAMEETGRVNKLITELLNLVNTRESKFELNSLQSLIDDMCFLISPKSKEKQIEIIKKCDPQIGNVRLDSEKFKQVILNILSNAVQFTPEKGRISIVTEKNISADGKENIHIEIKDNGAGIPEENIKNIFNPYFTTKHKSEDHNGTGLGLFIAHQNVLAHGGTIEVKSVLNEGTCFIIDIPMNSGS